MNSINKLKLTATWVLLSVLTPILLLAQTVGAQKTPTSIKDILCILSLLVLDFIPYVFVIAIGAFLIGLIKYVANGDNEEKRSAGTKMMIYGIVGFFFMISIWGIIQLFTNSFGLRFGVPQLESNATFTDTCPGNLTTHPPKK